MGDIFASVDTLAYVCTYIHTYVCDYHYSCFIAQLCAFYSECAHTYVYLAHGLVDRVDCDKVSGYQVSGNLI